MSGPFGRAKGALLSAMVSAPGRALISPMMRGQAAIFMLHRFADPDLGNPGHDLARLRANLETLRRARYRLVPLAEVIDRLAAGEPPPSRSVVFTIDDGYADIARAVPVFAAFDCPVTVFAITGFLDRSCWCWWDEAEYAFLHSARAEVTLEVEGRPAHWRLTTAESRRAAADDLAERLKLVPEERKRGYLSALAATLEVAVPALPPREYAALTWDEARACAAGGLVSFGPHTVTHPILSRTDDARAAREIGGSWERLRQEIPGAVPVFCYPNGDRPAFGARERALVERAGLRAALSTMRGYASRATFAGAHDLGRYALPRFPYPGNENHLLQVVSGLRRLRAAITSHW